jgi:hypothetical protein
LELQNKIIKNITMKLSDEDMLIKNTQQWKEIIKNKRDYAPQLLTTAPNKILQNRIENHIKDYVPSPVKTTKRGGTVQSSTTNTRMD